MPASKQKEVKDNTYMRALARHFTKAEADLFGKKWGRKIPNGKDEQAPTTWTSASYAEAVASKGSGGLGVRALAQAYKVTVLIFQV